MSIWILLPEAHARIGYDSQSLLGRILRRGRVQGIAKRDDRPSEPPDYVDGLLSKASDISVWNDEIVVSRPSERWPIRLREVRLHWPQLAAELEVVGFKLPNAKRKTEKPQQVAFLKWAKGKWPDGVPDTVPDMVLTDMYKTHTGITISDSTVRRALGRKRS
jgi:hypothetical protein